MKLFRNILIVFLCLLLCGCSAGNSGTAGTQTAVSAADLDLTEMSGTVVYAYVYSMLTEPDKFIGQTVKMNGSFAVYEGETQNYYACIIADAAACCSQGIEFVLSGDYSYPDDYPAPGSDITVTGEFSTYREGEYQYVTLLNAAMEVTE